MNLEKWPQLDELFAQALEINPSQRKTFLKKACGGDTELFLEMIAFLDNFDSACNYFDSFEESLGTVGEEPAPLPEKTLLGPYKIQHEIGRGGMSYVYLAERTDGMYEEKVAIKVLKKGLDTSAILNRFQKESQLLVNLRHSGIANLMDGGQTNDGQPYLVMEYIEGKPLDEALGKNALTLKDRLKLFLQIINAVQHAHSQLVVHRDLKPGNILVTNDNQVKLLDFGIAKLLVNSHENEFTQQGQRLFTPEYASPEQLAGERISTATDVYQLGLILERIIVEKKEAKGDLKIIIDKTLRPEPERRYTSAGDLGRDIKAYLENRPIEARPETWKYLAFKFVQRNKPGVIALGTILLLLFGGITTTTWQANRAKKALAQEQLARQKAESITSFLVSLFQSADPYERYDTIPGKDLTLEEFLFQSLPAIREDLANQPEVQLEMLEIMSKLYNRLSMKKEGYELSKEVLDSTRNHLGSHSPKYADGLFILAGAAADLEKFVEADSLFQLALSANREVYGFRPKHLSVVYNDYGIMAYTQGKSVLADSLYRESLRIMRINQIPDTANYAQTLNNHAQALQALGKVEEAYHATLKAVKILPLAGLDKTLYMAHTYHRLAGLLLAKDSIESAIDYQQKALDGFKNYLGPRDHFYALGLYQLAKMQEAQRDYSAQEKSLLESADIIAEIYGIQNRNYAAILSALGTSMHRQGKYEEAIRWQKQALETFEGVRDSAKAAVTLLKIASSMIFEEEFDEARLAIQKAEFYQRSLPMEDMQRVLLDIRKAHLQIAKGDRILGEKSLQEVKRSLEEKSAPPEYWVDWEEVYVIFHREKN